MNTEVAVDGTMFLINGRPTHEGVVHRGRSVEGLMLNSRMIQAVFDDANPGTAALWAYPDTGRWDPERNTDEFCAELPEYRRHGLTAVTVGLQGGGSVYSPDVYDNYVCSAYAADGSFRWPFFRRLERVLAAADGCGMVVIVNYFYWKHAARLRDEATIVDVTERVSEWLLRTGRRNVLVDVANESSGGWGQSIFRPGRIHELIEAAKGVAVGSRRLLVGSSSSAGGEIPHGKWLEVEDISLPHGNGYSPDELAATLRRLRSRMSTPGARGP